MALTKKPSVRGLHGIPAVAGDGRADQMNVTTATFNSISDFTKDCNRWSADVLAGIDERQQAKEPDHLSPEQRLIENAQNSQQLLKTNTNFNFMK